jgi:hypothetical protein
MSDKYLILRYDYYGLVINECTYIKQLHNIGRRHRRRCTLQYTRHGDLQKRQLMHPYHGRYRYLSKAIHYHVTANTISCLRNAHIRYT